MPYFAGGGAGLVAGHRTSQRCAAHGHRDPPVQGPAPLASQRSGSHDTSDAYQQILWTLDIACSMSPAGSCYDNATRERCFRSLKPEWTNHPSFAGLADARLSVFQ